MLAGRFESTTGRPYLEGHVYLPRLQVRGSTSFLVDTGADTSFLHPADGIRLGLDYSQLQEPTESVGIGGIQQNYQEPALLSFEDPGVSLHVYAIDIGVTEANPDIVNLPSLLGRDLLDRWLMTYAPEKSLLTFDVLSADLTEDFGG